MFSAFIRAKKDLITFTTLQRDSAIYGFNISPKIFDVMDQHLVHKQLTSNLIGMVSYKAPFPQ